MLYEKVRTRDESSGLKAIMGEMVNTFTRGLVGTCVYAVFVCVLGLVVFGLDLSARYETVGCFVHIYGNQNVEMAWIATPFIIAAFCYAASAGFYAETPSRRSSSSSVEESMEMVGVSYARTFTASNLFMIIGTISLCVSLFKALNNVLTGDCSASSIDYNNNADNLFGGFLATFFGLRTVLNLGIIARVPESAMKFEAHADLKTRAPWWEMMDEVAVAVFALYMWILYYRSPTGIINNFINNAALTSTDCRTAYTNSGWEPTALGFGKITYDAVSGGLVILDPTGMGGLAIAFTIAAAGLALFDLVHWCAWFLSKVGGYKSMVDITCSQFNVRLFRAVVSVFTGICMALFAYAIVNTNADPRCPILSYDNPAVKNMYKALQSVMLLTVICTALSTVVGGTKSENV